LFLNNLTISKNKIPAVKRLTITYGILAVNWFNGISRYNGERINAGIGLIIPSVVVLSNDSGNGVPDKSAP
jgi:hypothetical protein